MRKDYYIVLGVSRGADTRKIKEAYRMVVKKYHPDLTRSKESAERFLEIKEAYDTLGDEAKRRRYDEELSRRRSALRISDVPSIIERRKRTFDEVDPLFSRVDDFFSGFLPGFFETERRSEKELFFEVILSPREAARGGLYPLTVPVIEDCPRCRKTGFWEEFFCPLCYGSGRVNSEREFSLKIPPRVPHGTEIRLSMEDIGLRDTYLNMVLMVDPNLDRQDW